MKETVTRPNSLIVTVICGISILAFAVLILAPAPWRAEVVNDEMLHLESWRNRYGTDDQFPIFIARLEQSAVLSAENFEKVKSVYDDFPWLQRALFLLPDGHPPCTH